MVNLRTIASSSFNLWTKLLTKAISCTRYLWKHTKDLCHCWQTTYSGFLHRYPSVVRYLAPNQFESCFRTTS